MKVAVSCVSYKEAHETVDKLLNGCHVFVGVRDGNKLFDIVFKGRCAVFRSESMDAVVTLPKRTGFDALLKKILDDEKIRIHLKASFDIVIDTTTVYYDIRTYAYFEWRCASAGVDFITI